MSPIGDISKDFDYGYAITVHKSQGSTYTNVFVDEADIDTNKKHAERNKLKYVAFSRPTDVVHCLNTTLPAPRKLNEHEALMKNLWEKASNQQDTKEAILAIGRYLENNKLI
jgi:ATP-dependent exoDNAse (exonuclease V) alpha subunit